MAARTSKRLYGEEPEALRPIESPRRFPAGAGTLLHGGGRDAAPGFRRLVRRVAGEVSAIRIDRRRRRLRLGGGAAAARRRLRLRRAVVSLHRAGQFRRRVHGAADVGRAALRAGARSRAVCTRRPNARGRTPRPPTDRRTISSRRSRTSSARRSMRCSDGRRCCAAARWTPSRTQRAIEAIFTNATRQGRSDRRAARRLADCRRPGIVRSRSTSIWAKTSGARSRR